MPVIIKPKANYVIHDPETQTLLPSDGKHIHLTDFWYRRLHDGDVVLVDENNKQTEIKKVKKEKIIEKNTDTKNKGKETKKIQLRKTDNDDPL